MQMYTNLIHIGGKFEIIDRQQNSIFKLMKKIILLLLLCLGHYLVIKGQNTNDLLNLLISNKTITQFQADSIRAEAAIKQQETEKNRKWYQLNSSRPLTLSGYIHARYQNLDEPGKIDGMDIRRVRLDLRSTVNSYWSYRLQTDFAGSPKILDAYAECKINDYFNITAGQFKVPFSLENLTSSNKLEFIDRSQVVEAMVARGKDVIGNHNGRDIGLQIGGSFLKYNEKPLFEYRLGIFNGSGINCSDNNEQKDLAGRLMVHPFKGFDFGGGYYAGYAFWGQPSANVSRNRIGFEINYEFERFSLKSEYIKGSDGTADRSGWYAQAGYYIIPQQLQFLFKYDTFDPDSGKPDNISTQYVAVINYIFNAWTRLQAGYAFKNEEGVAINNNIGSIQLQVGF